MSNFEIFPEKPAPPPPPPPHPLDDLFTKVASLWLWTIFFVITSGLSVSFLSSLGSLLSTSMMGRGGGGFGGPGRSMYGDLLTYILPVVHIAGMLANVGSWAFLYIYFTVYLMPAVILRDPNGVDDRRRRMAASALRRTYLLTLAAGIARLLPELFLYLSPALSRIIF